MKRMSSFMRLSYDEKRILIRAGLMLGLIGLGLSLLPFQTFWYFVKWVKRDASKLGNGRSTFPQRMAWAVQLASRSLPGVTCLMQALALHVSLCRCGHASQVRIGVARTKEGGLDAHAWVEYQGAIIIGGSGYDRYTPLPMWCEPPT